MACSERGSEITINSHALIYSRQSKMYKKNWGLIGVTIIYVYFFLIFGSIFLQFYFESDKDSLKQRVPLIFIPFSVVAILIIWGIFNVQLLYIPLEKIRLVLFRLKQEMAKDEAQCSRLNEIYIQQEKKDQKANASQNPVLLFFKKWYYYCASLLIGTAFVSLEVYFVIRLILEMSKDEAERANVQLEIFLCVAVLLFFLLGIFISVTTIKNKNIHLFYPSILGSFPM